MGSTSAAVGNSSVISTSLGQWTLEGTVLSPARSSFVKLADALFNHGTSDAVVTFVFPGFDEVLTIHKTLLSSFDGPLKALVTLPFSEAESNHVQMREPPVVFTMIRKFLYCQPIDFASCPPEFPFVVDRWGIEGLTDAYFLSVIESGPLLKDLCRKCLPAMAYLQAPTSFIEYFADRFVVEFEADGINWFSDEHLVGTEFNRFFRWVLDNEIALNPSHDITATENAESLETDPAAGIETATEDEHQESIGYGDEQSLVTASDACAVLEQVRKGEPEKPEFEDLYRCAWVPANSIWKILARQKVLQNVIEKLCKYKDCSYTAELLHTVLSVSEKDLSEEETFDILSYFTWDLSTTGKALSKDSNTNWSARSWRLVARCQAKQVYGEDIAIVKLLCRDLTPAMKKWPVSVHYTLDSSPRAEQGYGARFSFLGIEFHVHLEASYGTNSREKAQATELGLYVFILSGNWQKYGDSLLSRKLISTITATNQTCNCGDKPEKHPFRHYSVSARRIKNVPIRTLVGRWQRLVVLNAQEIDGFLRGHGENCGLAFTLQIRAARTSPGEGIVEEHNRVVARGCLPR